MSARYTVVLSTLSLTQPPFSGIVADEVDYDTATKVMFGAISNPSDGLKLLAPYKVQIIERQKA